MMAMTTSSSIRVKANRFFMRMTFRFAFLLLWLETFCGKLVLSGIGD
jgi:hypothetical protein